MLKDQIEVAIKRAIEEDFAEAGDITSHALIDVGVEIRAEIVAKSSGVIAGIQVAEEVFKSVDPAIDFVTFLPDGERIEPITRIAEVSGDARAILAAERTALNFLQHLSGIATEAARYAERIKAYPAELLDTRKTTPGLRFLEKYAAHIGGAVNHRLGLYDQILIKDNHIRIVGDLKEAVTRARRAHPDLVLEVEAETIGEVRDALEAGADIILLDNMDVATLRQAVALIGDRALKEASGGITLDTIADVAATGVDRISVGAITQAAKPLDISMEIITE